MALNSNGVFQHVTYITTKQTGGDWMKQRVPSYGKAKISQRIGFRRLVQCSIHQASRKLPQNLSRRYILYFSQLVTNEVSNKKSNITRVSHLLHRHKML